MSDIPDDLKYTKTHEWVRVGNDGTVTVGITHYAQEALGDLVFVELPEIGQEVEIEEQCAVVESVKAASDIYSPIAGEVIKVNTALTEKPELVNSSPYEDGWLFKVKLAKESGLEELLTAGDYEEILKQEE